MLWAVCGLPAILWSGWFPLDVPLLFQTGAHFTERLHDLWSPYTLSGRYFPLYWLYNGLQFQVFGTDVRPYLLVQSLVFLATALTLCALARRLTGVVGLPQLLFVAVFLCSPVAENLATFGKQEPLATLLVVMVVALAYTGVAAARVSPSRGIAVAMLFALALWTKETSLALLGFTVTGVIISLFASRLPAWRGSGAFLRSYAVLTGWLGVGWLLAHLPFVLFPATPSSAGYLSYSVTTDLVRDNLAFYVAQQPDLFIFGGIGTVLLVRLLWCPRELRNEHRLAVVFCASVCAMCWAYAIGLLFWRWPMGYYLLLPGILWRLCALVALHLAIHSGAIRRTAAVTCGVVLALCVAYAALSNFYVSTSQIAYSRLYSRALAAYQVASAGQGALIIESYPFFSEQVTGTADFLKNQLGGTMAVGGIADLLDPAVLNPQMLELLGVKPADLQANASNLPGKGDYLLVFTGKKLATWFLRGVTPYFSEDSLLRQDNAYDMQLVAEQRISTPAMYFHVWTHQPTADRTWLGFKLYRVLDERPRHFWTGRYPDGWIGSNASLTIDRTYRGAVSIKLSTPYFLVPNRVRILEHGVAGRELEIGDTNEIFIDLGAPPETGNRHISFEVTRTAEPKAIGLNSDTRALGLRVALVHANDRSTAGATR